MWEKVVWFFLTHDILGLRSIGAFHFLCAILLHGAIQPAHHSPTYTTIIIYIRLRKLHSRTSHNSTENALVPATHGTARWAAASHQG
jgi:hypothetical protein